MDTVPHVGEGSIIIIIIIITVSTVSKLGTTVGTLCLRHDRHLTP